MTNGVVNQYYAFPLDQEVPMSEEKWATPVLPPGTKPVREGYQLSDKGRLISPNETLLRPSDNSGMRFSLRGLGSSSVNVRLDQIVLRTFTGPPENDDQIPIYLDGDYRNCAHENLAWGEPNIDRVTNLRVGDESPADKVLRAEKVKEPVKKRTPRKKRALKTAPKITKANYDDIEVSRVYRHRGTGLSIAVDEHGQAKVPKVNMSAEEMRVLSLLSQRIAEMNQILGLGGG